MKQPKKTQSYNQQIASSQTSDSTKSASKTFPAFSEKVSSIKDDSQPVVMEGLRQKVFLDRYALKAKSGELIEQTPEEMWRRVAWGIAQAEKPALRKVWEQRFYDVMRGFKFVPGGRILSGAGTGYEVTFFNCLPPDQEILTPKGYRAIKDVQVGDLVITGKKRARRVNKVFIRETKETMYHIKPRKLGFDDVRLTGEHPVLAIRDEWVNRHRNRDGLKLKQEPQWIKAAQLKKGDFVAVGWDAELKLKQQIQIKDYLSENFTLEDDYLTRERLHKPVKNTLELDEDFMLLAGTWLGDGCITHRAGTDIPVGVQITFNKTQSVWANQIAGIIQNKFSITPTVREDKWGQSLIQVRAESYVVGLFFKDLFGRYSYQKTIPQFLMQQPTDKILALIKGLFRSDGYLTESQIGIALSNKVLAVQLHQLLLRSGHFLSIFQNNAKGGRHDTYRLTGGNTQAKELSPYIYDEERTNTHHDQNYFLTYNDLHWVRIDSIQTTQYEGEVFDIEVEEDHSFITGGVIVSNCFVIPSPKDSRGGILESLKQLVEIQSRSGGVGLNLSSLRPKGARVKKVNGFSSGPVTWAGLFSYATHDVVQQGGCFAPDTLIMTHLGLVPVKDIIDQKRDWYAATHRGYQKITSKFDNGVKKVYEVKTAAGYSLKVTGEHKFLTVNSDGHFFLKPLADFKINDPVTLHLGDWRQDIPYSPLNSFIPAPSKFSFGRRKINLPKTLDEKLAFLVGVYDADGSKIRDEFSVNGKGLRIAVAANRLKDLQKIIETIKEVFGVEPVIKQGDGAVYNVCVYSREINEFLKLNGLLKEYSINVSVPNLIFSSPRSVVEAYLAGVFLGDGGNRGGKGGFRISTVSKSYAQQLQLLLLNLGVAAKINIQDRSNKAWRTLYDVTINGHRFMKRFYQIIEQFSEKVLDYPISKRDATFNWPFNLTEKFIYLSGFQRTIARTNVHTSQKAVAFLEASSAQLHEEDRDDIAILASSVPDKISSIELIQEQQVYDLEVDRVHLLSGNGFYTSNSRRGATMLMLWDWHPDIEEFITVKQDLSKINGANLSVCVSDSFMEAVKKDGDWDLVYPDLDDPKYDSHWNGELDEWKAMGGKVKVYKTVKAKVLWDLICEAAWRSAEPGLHFLERSNRRSNTHYFEKLSATNPCLTGDTLVATPSGWKRVDQIKEGEEITTVLGSGNVEKVEVYPNTPIYKVKFSDGSELRATAAHQFHAIKVGDRAKNSANKRFSQIMLKDLKIGDVVRVAPSIMPRNPVPDLPNGWDEREYGFFIGMLIGDGCITPKSIDRNVVKMAINLGEKEWTEMVRKVLLKTGSKVVTVDAHQGWQSANLLVQSSTGAAMMVRNSLLKPGYSYEKKIPLEYQNTNKTFLAGLIDGLFSTDGNVNLTTTHPQLRLKTTSKELALDLRRVLLNFGIHGRIATIKKVADSNIGGRAIISRHQQYEVLISGYGIKIFAEQIGISHPDKQKRLEQARRDFALTGNTWLAKILSIEPEGRETVYDLYEPKSDTWIAEGIVSRGCGEQPLGPWAVCNLGAMNLSEYVKDEQFDFEQFGQDVRIAMRLLDNVIDQTYYFFPQNEKCAKDIRRTGLGIMGLADALIKMKIRYGAKESLPTIRKIFQTLRDNAYIASTDIAKEKGSFPKFDKEKYLEGYHIKQLPQEIQDKIAKQGIRNAVLLTIAPTGTTSLVSGVSSGVEPVYEFSFLRRWRGGEEIVYHPLFDEWRKDHPNEQKPDYFVGANDLTPLEHVEVQSVAQEYIDSSISKTVNAPNSHSVDDVQTLYMAAYDMGLKGITYMRDGSRQGVLERVPEKKAEISPAEPVVPKPIHRPALLRGRTYKVNTPLGEGFITINRDENDQPYEVFITIAKGGSHTMADAEAIGRLISMTLRYSGDNRKEIAQKIVSQLRGIGGSSHIGFGKERVTSLADAVAKVLDQDLHLNELEKSAQQPLLESSHTTTGLANGQAKTSSLEISVIPAEPEEEVIQPQLQLESTQKSGDLCPECGNSTFVFEEGCQKCYSCGYSKC